MSRSIHLMSFATGLDVSCDTREPFRSRREPGPYLIASIQQPPPGEVPEGRDP